MILEAYIISPLLGKTVKYFIANKQHLSQGLNLSLPNSVVRRDIIYTSYKSINIAISAS
jgi:hypothetical protein